MKDKTYEAGIKAAADALKSARASGQTCAPVRDYLPEGDVDAAYAVQDIGTNLAVAEGRRIVGRKIGLTSPAVQRQFGISTPDFGILFHDMDVPLGEAVPMERIHQPKVEAEIAFVLNGSLNKSNLTIADLMTAVEYVVPAIEVVGSRIEGWDIRLVDTVADNASSGAFVLGHTPKRLHEVDVVSAKMVMRRRGEAVSTGSGAACLGSPLSAMLWLAKEMISRGRPLVEGDVVLSGALGPMVGVAAEDRFDVLIEGLGGVSAVFAG